MNDETAKFLKEKQVHCLQIYYRIGDYSHKYLQGFAAKMSHHRPCISILYSLQMPVDCVDENTTGCVLTLLIKTVRTEFCWLTWFTWLLKHPVSPKLTLVALRTLCFDSYSWTWQELLAPWIMTIYISKFNLQHFLIVFHIQIADPGLFLRLEFLGVF